MLDTRRHHGSNAGTCTTVWQTQSDHKMLFRSLIARSRDICRARSRSSRTLDRATITLALDLNGDRGSPINPFAVLYPGTNFNSPFDDQCPGVRALDSSRLRLWLLLQPPAHAPMHALTHIQSHSLAVEGAPGGVGVDHADLALYGRFLHQCVDVAACIAT